MNKIKTYSSCKSCLLVHLFSDKYGTDAYYN